jgi:hypothetical protein
MSGKMERPAPVQNNSLWSIANRQVPVPDHETPHVSSPGWALASLQWDDHAAFFGVGKGTWDFSNNGNAVKTTKDFPD